MTDERIRYGPGANKCWFRRLTEGLFWTPSNFFALFEEFEVLDNLREDDGEESFHSWSS